jgi:hypothetical protein
MSPYTASAKGAVDLLAVYLRCDVLAAPKSTVGHRLLTRIGERDGVLPCPVVLVASFPNLRVAERGDGLPLGAS